MLQRDGWQMSRQSSQHHADAQSRTVILHDDFGIVQLHDGRNKAKSQATPACTATLVKTIKSSEHARVIGGYDPRAVIGYGEARTIARLCETERDCSAGWCMGKRVLNKIDDELNEKLRVTSDMYI